MSGAHPNTRWLDGRVMLNSKGFIKTGPDLLPEIRLMHAGPLPVNHTCLKLACRFFAVGDPSDGEHKACRIRRGEE